MRKKILFIILGIITIFILLFVFIGKNKIEDKNIKNSYSFLKVEKDRVMQTVNVDGTVISTQEVDLRFQANGVIEKINYSTGEKVKKGDVLASLNSRDQEIAVKQREASLVQARANLNLKLAGAGDEDIAVYQSKIDNAKKNVETTMNSTMKDIKNSEARVASAQIVFNEAVINLETIKKQNDVDLSIAYEGARGVIDSSLLIIEKTLDDVNDFWENDALDDLFSVKNSQYKSESSYKYSQAKNNFEIILEKNRAMDNAEYLEIDGLLNETKDNLNDVQSFLDSIFNGLVSTVTSSALTQTSLESYKTSVNNLRAGANTAISNIENKQQSILQIMTKSNTNVSGAKAVISTAQAALDLERANLESMESRAEAQNSQAENSLTLVDNEYALKISTPRDVDIAYLQASVYEASALLDLAKENFNKTILKSPVEGIVSDVGFDIGESINSTNIFIKIASNEKKIEANIPEIDIGKVEVGNKVEIILDAFTDKMFAGKIISIDPVETNIQGVVYYKADIFFDDASSSVIVFPGMTANVNILTATKDNVLSLPRSAVKNDKVNDEISLGHKNKYYIQIFQNNEIIQKEIEVGLIGDEKVEIISGIKSGEEVVDFILKTNAQ